MMIFHYYLIFINDIYILYYLLQTIAIIIINKLLLYIII